MPNLDRQSGTLWQTYSNSKRPACEAAPRITARTIPITAVPARQARGARARECAIYCCRQRPNQSLPDAAQRQLQPFERAPKPQEFAVKKPMKVKFKKKDTRAPTGHNARKHEGTVTKISTSIEDRIIRYARAEGLDDVSDAYNALMGHKRPVDQAICSNVNLLAACQESIVDTFLCKLGSDATEVGVQVTRVSMVSANRALIDVPEARKAAQVYKRAKVDGVAGVRLCAVPDPETGDVIIATDVVALFGGNGVRTKVSNALQRARMPLGMGRSDIEWLSRDDPHAVSAAFKSIFGAPWTQLPNTDPFFNPRAAFNEASPSGLRALITLMCRSQLTLRRMLIYFGDAKPICTGAIGTVEHALMTQCKGDPEILHRDVIPHFWFDELKRLGLDRMSVPAIKLH